jgi:integrase
VPGYIEDRWYTKRPDPATGKRRKTARHGKGKRWRVAGIPGVRDRSFTNLDGKDGAKTWLAKAQNESTSGEFYDPRDGTVTLRWYVEEKWWPNLRVPLGSRQTVKGRVFNHVLPHIGSLPLNRIGPDEIKAWLKRIEEDLDVNTVIAVWHAFSTIMQAASKAKRIPVNPFRDPDLKPPRRPKSKAKAWPKQTVASVRRCLPDRYRITIDLGVGAGLRQGEALAFSPDDIDEDVIHVTRQIVWVDNRLAFAPPKGNKERDAPCPPELAAAVKAHMAQFEPLSVTLPWLDPDRPNLPWEKRPQKTVRLLVTTARVMKQSTGAVNRNSFDDKVWKPALVAAGVIPKPEVTVIPRQGLRTLRRVKWEMPREDGFHATRHTFASVVLHAGETVQKLADWLGHSDPAFTYRTYAHFLPESGEKALTELGTWLTGREVPQGPASVEDLSQQEAVDLIVALAEHGMEGLPENLRSRLVGLTARAS